MKIVYKVHAHSSQRHT